MSKVVSVALVDPGGSTYASNKTAVQQYHAQDANAPGASSYEVVADALPFLFNGVTYDRQRGNMDVALLPSASRTTTQNSGNITNYNGRGIKVTVNMTVVGTGSITATIVGVDANGVTYTILASAAIATNVFTVLTVYPGAPVAANVSANDVLPRTFQVNITANNANAATYSVAYSLLV